jgi:hypothetical protein
LAELLSEMKISPVPYSVLLKHPSEMNSPKLRILLTPQIRMEVIIFSEMYVLKVVIHSGSFRRLPLIDAG